MLLGRNASPLLELTNALCYKALPITVWVYTSGGCLPTAILDSPLLSVVNGIGSCKKERRRLVCK